MELPEFMTNFHSLELPFPDDVVQTNAIRSEQGIMVIFRFLQDFALPAHAHKGQWGTVLEGEIELTIGDDTQVSTPGMSYNIPAGVEHSAQVKAGSTVMDIFEEPDRYPLRES